MRPLGAALLALVLLAALAAPVLAPNDPGQTFRTSTRLRCGHAW